jgi:sugar phosphate isomerase/epimerase
MEHRKSNAFVFNTTAAKLAPLAIEVDIAQKVGFDGLETTETKVRSFLNAGHSLQDLKELLGGLPVYGLGTVINIERNGSAVRALVNEAQRLFSLARDIGARGVTLINGPLDFREVERFRLGLPARHYRGVIEHPPEEQIEITAGNLKLLAHIAKDYGVLVYLEALAWTPLNTARHQLALIRKAGHDNLRLVVDLWHFHASGSRPEDLASFDKEFIYGVHVCDSLPLLGNLTPDEAVLRDVATGEGVIDLNAWVDAIKATGYQDWWCSETFCRKTHEQNSYEIARALKEQLAQLIGVEDVLGDTTILLP